MESNLFVKFGLSEGESKVYLTLLKIGKSNIGNIIKDSQVSHSKVYDILERLAKKGLVGAITINNKKQFEAKDPERLLEYLKNKEKTILKSKKELKEILPLIRKFYKTKEKFQEAEILQGISGIKTFVESALRNLNPGETFFILGSPKESIEKLDAYFLEWHKERINKKVLCKMLYNFSAKEIAKTRFNLKLTKIRFLPEIVKSPVVIDIAKDYVGIILFGERPLCFMIKNNELSQSYREYFELLWSLSEK